MRTSPLTCDDERRRLFELLNTLPTSDVLYAGQDDILGLLTRLGVTRHSGRRITWTQVRRWARFHGFPLLFGGRRGRQGYSSITSERAVVAWILSRRHNGELFRVFQAGARQGRGT